MGGVFLSKSGVVARSWMKEPAEQSQTPPIGEARWRAARRFPPQAGEAFLDRLQF
jgi:hypothetical protein